MSVKKTTSIILLALTLISVQCWAESGQSSSNYRSLRYGLMFGGQSFKLDDPDGDTESVTAPSLVNVLLVSDLTRDKRLFVNLFGQGVTLEASQEEIGQDITRTGITGALQFGFLQKTMWAGIGLGAIQEKYESRHIVDANGFLQTEYEDREQVAFPFLANLTYQYSINRDLDVGLHFQVETPLKGDIQTLGLYAFILY